MQLVDKALISNFRVCKQAQDEPGNRVALLPHRLLGTASFSDRLSTGGEGDTLGDTEGDEHIHGHFASNLYFMSRSALILGSAQLNRARQAAPGSPRSTRLIT